MAAKAPMIEDGIATAAMIVERKFFRKRSTMMAAKNAAEHEVLFDRVE